MVLGDGGRVERAYRAAAIDAAREGRRAVQGISAVGQEDIRAAPHGPEAKRFGKGQEPAEIAIPGAVRLGPRGERRRA